MSKTNTNLVGAYAYSATGGIEAVNRFVIARLHRNAELGEAFLLWDDPSQEKAGARPPTDRVRMFSRRRARWLAAMFGRSARHSRDRWMAMHVNYAFVTLLAARGAADRVCLFLYAAELDLPLTATQRFAMRRIKNFVAISEYTKQKAVGRGIPAERITVLPLGSGSADNVPSFSPRRGPPTVLFVGRMDEHYKGQEALLKAMLIVKSARPDCRLAFIGGGQTLPMWSKRVESMGLSDRVELRGRVSAERLDQSYAEATIFAMPSMNEGFGLVYLEAMAHGLPCIAGNADAAQEIVVDGQTGVCVPPGDPVAVAAAILRLVNDPDLSRRLGEAGRERYCSIFTEGALDRRLADYLSNWRSACK